MKILIKSKYKSINPCEFELPDFSVLTGKNGSGKTHLLEAIASSTFTEVKIDDRIINNIRYIKFNELNPAIKETCDPKTITQFIKKTWTDFTNAKTQRSPAFRQNITSENILQSVADVKSKNFIQKVYESTGKDLNTLTEDDLFDNFDISFMGQNDFFTAQFALIFKNYHRVWEENNMAKYYKSQGIEPSSSILEEAEFLKLNGNPPWDFVNKILSETNIPYTVNNPMGTRLDSNFIFKLKDNSLGFEINSQDLSTGEKVLMSLALAIYNTNGDFGKPDLLLIDEPDAALHPSMSKVMVDVLKKNIVMENKIPVIITTHSPTTVISAEGVSIFQLLRGNSIPEKIPTQKAVELLSSDVPFLKISNDKRRQVFVESKYDVQYYELLTNILSLQETLPSEPVFIPARTSNGSNCTDVIDIVRNLSANGNEQIYGIIDWDLSNVIEEKIVVLGINERYAIENFILDPLIMGLLFIRERKINIANFGSLSFSKYTDVHLMTKDDAQTIIDKVLQDLDLLTTNRNNYNTYNGWTLKLTEEFSKHQGHDLEILYKTKFPFLNIHQREDSLKKDVIEKVINDYPQFTPNEIFNTIKCIK